MSKKTMLMLVAAALVVALGAGVATATIPDSSGTIHGCYKKANGNLTIVDTGKGATCQASEAAVTWSQQGAQGLPGPQGVQGLQGKQGSAGPDGVGDYTIVTAQGTTSGGDADVFADCPTGGVAVGGGFDIPPDADVSPFQSQDDGDAWDVWVFGDNGVTFTVYAVCVGKQQLMGS
jgi:hypothetical protein